MKISDLIAQLQAVLPKYCDDFSDVVAVSTLTQAAGVATATCAAAHGLATNDYALIRGALSPNPITSLTQIGGVATAVTANAHDLTSDISGQLITISGAADAKYNGQKVLLDVIDGNTFTFTVDATATSPDVGSPVLNENKATGFNGRVKVTVVNTVKFTYAVSAALPAAASGTIQAVTGIRISGAITQEYLSRVYTEQAIGKIWLWVIPPSTVASHNRSIQNDATFNASAGQAFQQLITQSPQIVIITPTTNELAARAAVDHMDDIRPLLFKSVLGVAFDSGNANGAQFGLTYTGDKVLDYNSAYYAHEFNFEMLAQIDNNDICQEDDSVAFRSFDFEWIDAATAQAMRSVTGQLP